MVTGTGDDVVEHLCVMGPELPLPPAPEVAASSNDEYKDNHGQDRRDSGRYAGPVHVNEGDSVVRLINGSLLIDCLLYTSPSPRDRQKSRMPSSA